MNVKTRLFTALPLLALPLFAFDLRGDEVSFHPEDGVAVQKELTLTSEFFLDDLRVVADGQELPPDMFGSAMEEALLFDLTIGVSDEYVSSEGGKVLTLLRTFENLALEAGPESGAESVDEFGELEDSTVKFQWDEESSEYVKSFPEGKGDEALLENLEVDMDLTALLPQGEVSEGDTWEVKGESLGTVFLPGGMPAAPSSDDEDAEEISELFKEELEAQFQEAFDEFVVRCKYAGQREEGDITVGVITFEFEGQAAIDLSDLIQSVIDLQAGDMGLEADISASVDLEFDGEGTLLWNLAAGHVNHFDMSGELTILADAEADIDAGGESHSGELSAEVSSEMKWSMTASGADE